MPHKRPESTSRFSFKSKRSHKSNESGSAPGPKLEYKRASVDAQDEPTTLNGKSDPSKAINESEPAALANDHSTSLEPIRGLQYRDKHGNPITEPDRSNPTRDRWERPLDTIRSFEAAIDGGYRKSPIPRTESSDGVNGLYGRRNSSYHGLNNNGMARFSQDAGSYGNRAGPSRPDSMVDGYGSPYQSPQNRQGRYGQRMNSDPMLAKYNNTAQPVYPNQGYQQSYDTVVTGASGGSHVTEPWGNSTDPSSENSSIDKLQQAAKPDMAEAYGFNGFGGVPQFQTPIHEEQGQGDGAYGQPAYGGAPPVMGGNGMYPPQSPTGGSSVAPFDSAQSSTPRPVIKLGGPGGAPSSTPVYTPAESKAAAGDKRKSWLKRRFSKN